MITNQLCTQKLNLDVGIDISTDSNVFNIDV